MPLLWSYSWAWSLSLPPQPQPPGDSYFTTLRLRLQRLTPVPFLMAITHCESVYHLGDRVAFYQFSLSSERNITLSTSSDEENLILLDVPSPPFSDSALDSMSPIMSGNRVWSTLQGAWRRALLSEIASALVEVISPLRNTSVVFELVIYEDVCRVNPTEEMPRMIPLVTLANVFFDIITLANSEEDESLAIQESSDLAQQHIVTWPVPKILLDSLVTEVYSGNSSEEECVICKEEYVGGTEVIRLPCSHRFHGDCITPWLQERDTCPICRRGIHM